MSTHVDADARLVPECVARYFRFALGSGRESVAGATLRCTGTFAARPEAWAPFSAVQHITANPPRFTWDARIRMMRVVPVRVRDSYDAGQGRTHATIGGLVTLVDSHGTKEIAVASLQRFLAEAVWVPTALLPRKGLSWSEIDGTTARVTITDSNVTASIDATFGAHGELVAIAAMRFRDVGGTPLLTRWEGLHCDYQCIDGVMIPTSGEVAWVLPEGRAPYWRGRLTDVRFER